MAVYKDSAKGTWLVKFSYKDWQGNLKFTTKRGFKTRREAVNYEREFKASAEEQADITVNTLAEKFLEDKKLHVKESTYKATRTILRNEILPFIGELKLKELTPLVMRKWQNEMLKRDLKQGSLMEINRKCSALLNYAVKFYGLKENPLRKAGSIGRKESSQKFWELSDFQKFIETVKNPLHQLSFNLLFYSGMRVGELLALNVEDFDLEKNIIHVNKNLPVVTNKLTTPKTESSIRAIEMPAEIMKQVAEYISTVDEITSPLLQVSYQVLYRSLSRRAKKLGLEPITLHGLRHSHASFLITHGVPITAISKRLGHKSPKITLETYSHMYKESGEQIAELLNKTLI